MHPNKRTGLASRLNKQVELQTPTETTDTGGGFTVTWATTYTVWAQMQPLKGKEFFEYATMQGVTAYRFVIRYLSGINPKMRIKYGTRIFNIRAIINPNEKGEMLEILAEEGVAV